MATLYLGFEPAAVVYHRHHMHCIQCIAGGRGSMYGHRCPVGLQLWNSYQSSQIAPVAVDRAGFSPHEAAAAGVTEVTPVGNTGGTYLRGVSCV